MSRAAADASGFGEYLFAVHCWVVGAFRAVVIVLIVVGLVVTGGLASILYHVESSFAASLMALVGLAATFLFAFRRWRQGRCQLRAYEDGLVEVRGVAVDATIPVAEIDCFAVAAGCLYVYLRDGEMFRWRVGPVDREELADYLEERDVPQD